jgi:hypothetical protein
MSDCPNCERLTKERDGYRAAVMRLNASLDSARNGEEERRLRAALQHAVEQMELLYPSQLQRTIQRGKEALRPAEEGK